MREAWRGQSLQVVRQDEGAAFAGGALGAVLLILPGLAQPDHPGAVAQRLFSSASIDTAKFPPVPVIS